MNQGSDNSEKPAFGDPAGRVQESAGVQALACQRDSSLGSAENKPKLELQRFLERALGDIAFRDVLVWIVIAAGAFHAAYALPQTGFLIIIYLFALLQLARAKTWRMASYAGLAVGLLIAAVQLVCFLRIFSAGAVALWLVYAFWIGLFVATARLCLRRLKLAHALLLIPFLWLGFEYFRSELYYLRFSWLNAGYAFAGLPSTVPLKYFGMYGTGFLLMGIVACAVWVWSKAWLRTTAVLTFGIGALWLLGKAGADKGSDESGSSIHVAGIQMEFPTEKEVLLRLDELIHKHPESDLLVLSEYTFTSDIPSSVKAWCAKNRRYLVIGGEAPAPNKNYYDTAFVIGPEGKVVFQQGKAVPIQFFRDGLPAPNQELWQSPWGKIGFCVCYDLSYTRVTDRLVRMGAQALVVPTMDVADWGKREHELHARVAPIRAAEYGIPIFRVASSGISQLVTSSGHVVSEAPYPGDGAILTGLLQLRSPGSLPLDRWLAPFAVCVTVLTLLWFLFNRNRSKPSAAPPQLTETRTEEPLARAVAVNELKFRAIVL